MLATVLTHGEGSHSNLSSIARCHVKAILSFPQAKNATDAVSNIKKLDDLIRRCKKARNCDLDEVLKAQRMFDIPTLQHRTALNHVAYFRKNTDD